jgi:hypothetical protein
VDQEGYFAIRYPKSWSVASEGRRSIYLTSWNPASWDGPGFPPGSIKLDIVAAPWDDIEKRPDGAQNIEVDGLSGWQIIYKYDPPQANGVTKAHQVVLRNQDQGISITAIYAAPETDETTFAQVLSSLEAASGVE